MNLRDWLRNTFIGPDPMEPASPPPFALRDRVITSSRSGLVGRGVVVDVEFTTDRNNAYGPWIITVLLDKDNLKMVFHAAELTLELTIDELDLLPPVHLDDCVVVPLGLDTPLYDDVSAEAQARDGLAAEVETWLRGAS